MKELPFVIIFLGLLIFSAHIFNALFAKTKIPNVLWLLLIGIVIGPITGFVKPDHFGLVGPVFTTFTLILLLFESGVNLKVGALAKSIGSAFLLTVVNFILSAVIATVCAKYLTGSLDWMTASFFGVIVAGTSSAVVIPMVHQLKMNEKGETILLLESALSDVLCLVVGLALLQAWKEGEFSMGSILDTVWKSFLFALLLGVIAGLLWSIFIHKMRNVKNYTFTNLALVMIVYGLAEWAGWNGGIATLGFGIALGNAYLLNKTAMKEMMIFREVLPEERSFFSELVFVMQTYFFVYVGVCIQFSVPMIYAIALLIVALVILLRPVTVRVLVRGKLTFKDLSIMSIMSPKGLVPAILATIPFQMGLEPVSATEDIKDLSYAVVLSSIIICAVLVIILSKDPFAIGYFRMLFGKKAGEARAEAEAEAAAAIAAEQGTLASGEGEGVDENGAAAEVISEEKDGEYWSPGDRDVKDKEAEEKRDDGDGDGDSGRSSSLPPDGGL